MSCGKDENKRKIGRDWPIFKEKLLIQSNSTHLRHGAHGRDGPGRGQHDVAPSSERAVGLQRMDYGDVPRT